MITPTMPEALFVSGSSICPYTSDDWIEEDDPRGLLLMWEPPSPKHKYIIGMDPTEGISNWTRGTRVPGDVKTDNGVIEVFRPDGDFDLVFKEVNGIRIPDEDPRTHRQRRLYTDVQAAEFAAPCDAVELARVVNLIGRIYAGDEEDQPNMFEQINQLKKK